LQKLLEDTITNRRASPTSETQPKTP